MDTLSGLCLTVYNFFTRHFVNKTKVLFLSRIKKALIGKV